MSEKLSLLSCFGFQTLGSRYGSLNHRSQTIWFSFTGMQNYSRSYSKVISVVCFNCTEGPHCSFRISEVVMGAGWKRVKVGWRTVLRSKRSWEVLLEGMVRMDSGSDLVRVVQGRMGGKALTDAVFLLWFSTVKVSTDAVHCLVVGKVGSATSPPVEVDIASAALRENVQKPPKV
ncbi:hypothetical protein V6N12_023637 [Hibiscus sabdariffa]|uniref:Uncharacterized protein n=1 Tax=Hibiscus sabdariffa TaxID=183260 RepID=A0ABR2FY87_9ROSI